MKRIIIVHGWEGTPESDWMPWLAKTLRAQEHTVIVPTMPDTHEPRISAWVNHLTETVGALDSNTFFIGHSIGCQTIMRYLEKQTNACGGALFVAGWFHLIEGADDIAAPWLTTPVDFARVKKNLPRSFALFSDDDPYVPITDAKLFKERLGSETVIEHGHEHYNESEEPSIVPLVKRLLA